MKLEVLRLFFSVKLLHSFFKNGLPSMAPALLLLHRDTGQEPAATGLTSKSSQLPDYVGETQVPA